MPFGELPQCHCGDDREGTLFSWLHVFHARLASVRFEHFLCPTSRIITCIMLLAQLVEHFLIHWYHHYETIRATCIIVLFLNLEFKLKSLFQYPNTLMDSECYRLLLEPGLWPEGSYELGSVIPFFRLSVLLSGGFLWIG